MSVYLAFLRGHLPTTVTCRRPLVLKDDIYTSCRNLDQGKPATTIFRPLRHHTTDDKLSTLAEVVSISKVNAEFVIKAHASILGHPLQTDGPHQWLTRAADKSWIVNEDILSKEWYDGLSLEVSELKGYRLRYDTIEILPSETSTIRKRTIGQPTTVPWSQNFIDCFNHS